MSKIQLVEYTFHINFTRRIEITNEISKNGLP